MIPKTYGLHSKLMKRLGPGGGPKDTQHENIALHPEIWVAPDTSWAGTRSHTWLACAASQPRRALALGADVGVDRRGQEVGGACVPSRRLRIRSTEDALSASGA